MKAAFNSVFLHRLSLSEVVRLVAQAGYECLELNAETLSWARPHVTPDMAAIERQRLLADVRAHGMTVSAVCAHTGMVGEEARERRRAVEFVQGCTDLAVDVGAPVVHIVSGERPKDVAEAAAWAWFVDAVQETADYAQRKGIKLGIEAVAGYLFHGIDDYIRMWRDAPGSEIYVNFDPSHLYVQGEDLERAVDVLGGRVAHMHAKDGKGRFPDFEFPPLGRGAIDFGRLLRHLKLAGYDGVLSVEYEAHVFGYDESEGTVLRHERDFLRQLGI